MNAPPSPRIYIHGALPATDSKLLEKRVYTTRGEIGFKNKNKNTKQKQLSTAQLRQNPTSSCESAVRAVTRGRIGATWNASLETHVYVSVYTRTATKPNGERK